MRFKCIDTQQMIKHIRNTVVSLWFIALDYTFSTNVNNRFCMFSRIHFSLQIPFIQIFSNTCANKGCLTLTRSIFTALLWLFGQQLNPRLSFFYQPRIWGRKIKVARSTKHNHFFADDRCDQAIRWRDFFVLILASQIMENTTCLADFLSTSKR